MKVLVSAYACEPGKGSEPGVGWNAAVALASRHDVWVLTRANNRAAIERQGPALPSRLHFLYFDLPKWLRWWKRKQFGIHLYYYLWQVGAYGVARRAHKHLVFDVAHHVTFVKYNVPSFICLLPIPFVFGPVGGGEEAPGPYWRGFGGRGIAYECLRALARWLGDHDPFVRLTARRARLALATTAETAERLRRLGAKSVSLVSEAGLNDLELERLMRDNPRRNEPVTFVSIGRLLHWKGVHLGLAAYLRANIPESVYWIVGHGPYRARLQEYVQAVGLSHRVIFWGALTRPETLGLLQRSDVLVHLSLHDSGGWVCLEGMAAGKPVICLDLGGPGSQVTEDTGFRIAAPAPEDAVSGTAEAMQTLARDPALRTRLGTNGRERVSLEYRWSTKADRMATEYELLVGTQAS